MTSAKNDLKGLLWRSSSWTITFVVGLGIAVDLLVYSVVIPVMPFQLERLGFSNVAARTGWLLFAYATTIPIAMISERYKARQIPLILGLVILIASQVVLMEAHNFAVMCVARVLQGLGSSMVWVVGLALLCDSSPPSIIGLQIGLAMCGLSVGLAIGPPAGGLLYTHYGYRGPFIFGIAASVLDLLGRLIIIERKTALLYGVDPAADSRTVSTTRSNATVTDYDDNSSGEGSGTNIQESSKELTILPSGPSKSLSLFVVIARLSKSPRALVSLLIILIYGIVYSGQEPTIPLHLQQTWNLNSRAVGLVFIAAVVPTLFSSPLAGYLADRRGTEWITVSALLLALPWWIIITIQGPLALFISAFAIESFFTSAIISPVTAELAAVSRGMEGVGYGHVYGAFNFVYGIGTSVGPIIGGQIYDHVGRGWLVLCVLAMSLLALSLLLAFCFIGGNPLIKRLRRRLQITSLHDHTS
ncbi:major facilitator superfamily domain-containing protein [Gymnopilus junonius]|uniref:Major facilitator superfamily domain-containing protein n=1 Tax=Gymnopilus junonius TaxID=109634 RepID=A0A9P5TT90_GYMJU|nr:major facilitator superfamily domain-containing protein [Gymnopilus junonius]